MEVAALGLGDLRCSSWLQQGFIAVFWASSPKTLFAILFPVKKAQKATSQVPSALTSYWDAL